MRWHGVGVGVDSAPASARSGVGQSVGPGLGIPCRRRRRRGRRGPRRGRRFQVQVPARPRVRAEITVCRVGQPSALLMRRARLHDSLGDLRVHGVLGYGSEHASCSGPRHRRRSSKRWMGPRRRPRLSGASATVAGDAGRQSEDSRRPPPAPGLCCSKTAAFESMKDEPNRRPRMRGSSAAVEWTSAGWRGDRWAPTPAPAAADCGKSL